MGAVKLSDAVVAALVCPAGRKDVMFFDTQLKGFGLRVTAGGARVFLYQYRLGPKVRRHPLGDWPTITAAQARRLAEVHRGAVRGGGDPVAEKRAKRNAQLEAEATAKRDKLAVAFTFEALLSAWETRGLAERRASYRVDALRRLRKSLAPLLDRPASAITRVEAAAILDVLARTNGPIGANRIMAYARASYGWGMKANLVEANPFSGLVPPGRERPRDRVLTDGEVGAIWRAAGTLGPVHGAYVRFLLLTLQRREEVAGATWSEFSAYLSMWTVPAERAKNGRAHLVHLAAAAVKVLQGVPRSVRRELVFGLPGGGKLTAFSAIKRSLDASMKAEAAELARKAGQDAAPVPAWTFHDFRRTGVTTLAGLGFAPHVCDRLLNHVTGAIQGVAAVYQRAEFLAERKAALEAWALHVGSEQQ